MSRGKLAAALAVAAFVCMLAPAFAQYAQSDSKYGRQEYKDDKNDYNGYNNDYKDDKNDKNDYNGYNNDYKDDKNDYNSYNNDYNGYNNDYKGYNNDGHDDSKWEGHIQHTEYLVCKHCGNYSALANSVLLNTFNFVKVYGSDLDTSLCLTLHIVYLFILILDKVLEQNLHALTDGLTRLLKTVVAHPKLSKILQKTGLMFVALFRCAMSHLHKTFIF